MGRVEGVIYDSTLYEKKTLTNKRRDIRVLTAHQMPTSDLVANPAWSIPQEE